MLRNLPWVLRIGAGCGVRKPVIFHRAPVREIRQKHYRYHLLEQVSWCHVWKTHVAHFMPGTPGALELRRRLVAYRGWIRA